MEGIFLNSVLDMGEENVFDFIEDKLNFAVGDYDDYLTPIGSYIVMGTPFYSSFDEWANIEGKYECDEYFETFEDCSESTKAMLRKRYPEIISSWLDSNNLSAYDLEFMRLLRMQYKAIENLSQGKDVDNAEKTIARTKMITGQNCLEYLVFLKPVLEGLGLSAQPGSSWTALRDMQGSQLCAVLTGIDPCFRDSELLSRMHEDFEYYKDLINEITRVQSANLQSALDEIYYNSNASIPSRIRRMVSVAGGFFEDKNTATQFVLSHYDSNVREVDIRKKAFAKEKTK